MKRKKIYLIEFRDGQGYWKYCTIRYRLSLARAYVAEENAWRMSCKWLLMDFRISPYALCGKVVLVK